MSGPGRALFENLCAHGQIEQTLDDFDKRVARSKSSNDLAKNWLKLGNKRVRRGISEPDPQQRGPTARRGQSDHEIRVLGKLPL